MSRKPLMVIPVEAPVYHTAFDLHQTIIDAVARSGETLQDGDVLAVSSKYTAISEGRVIRLDDVVVSAEAERIAERYQMNSRLVQLVMQEADHVFGGISGFLLTYKQGILSPNAGIDRSNVPNGFAVLFPEHPYQSAARLRQVLRERLGVDAGVILTDSWLMPGRLGTSGVALATAGFRPIQDERGKIDLFGNPMHVTQRGIADSICVCAQMVMGETAEATPIAIVRNTGVELVDIELGVADVAIDWQMCIYVESLTHGLLDAPAAVVLHPNGSSARKLKAQDG
ncbi:MAG: coenzyme F420-0:L-glutamate ligase [Anaerolineaceae bacterium]|nr:coenzyme F420-0:L-glutamate ligase [Anaerolineaceae bacterium]